MLWTNNKTRYMCCDNRGGQAIIENNCMIIVLLSDFHIFMQLF